MPPLPGAAVGQLLFAVAGSAGAGAAGSLKAGALDDVFADGGALSELQAARVMAAEAAQTASATDEDTRKEFTARRYIRATRPFSVAPLALLVFPNLAPGYMLSGRLR